MAKEINLFEQELALDRQIEPDLEPALQDFSDINAKNSTHAHDEQLAEVLNTIVERQENLAEYTQARSLVKRVIESLLFASSDPLPFQKIREITDTIYPFKPRVIYEIIRELEIEYHSQQRAFRLEEIAQGYILRTRKEYSSYIELLYRNKRGEKLSQAATEVLAIIAYRQPITRPHIEAIRGVDSSGIVQALLERQLIEAVGKLEAPGRPTLYGITKDFLKHYGLRDLKELPKMTSLSPEGTQKPIQHGPSNVA